MKTTPQKLDALKDPRALVRRRCEERKEDGLGGAKEKEKQTEGKRAGGHAQCAAAAQIYSNDLPVASSEIHKVINSWSASSRGGG